MNEFSANIGPASDKSNMGESAQRAAQSIAAAGRTVGHAASDLAKVSAETIKDQASEFADTAKGIAFDAGSRLQGKVAEQKGAGAEYVKRLAHSIDRAADQFEGEFPIAGSYMRTVASQVDNAAEALRSGNIEDLIKRAQAFAKEQPTAFLGLAFLAGFGAVRFLKSTSSAAPQTPK
jgi:hypothetical protein